MQGTAYKPRTDHATTTFVQRCAQLGLAVWSYDGQALTAMKPDDLALTQAIEAHEEALTSKLQKSIKPLTRASEPIEIEDNHPAAWISDKDGMKLGFIVTPIPNQPGPLQTTTHLAATAKALSWTLSDLRRAEQNLSAVEDLAEQLGKSYENINLLYSIGRSMRSIKAPARLAQGICDQIRITQGYEWSAVRFIADQEDASGLSDACFITGELPCNQKDFCRATNRLLTQQFNQHWDKLLKTGQHELPDLVDSEVVVEPILHDGAAIGVVLAGGRAGPGSEATSGNNQLLEAIAGFLGALHENAARFIEQKTMFISSLEAVSTALDAKDRYTHGHSERVAWLGTQLAEAIGLGEDEVERIRISGLVHDVGKIGVSEAVLCKNGRLSEDEFEQIKKHPRIGYNILKGIPKIDDVLDGVLYHHERWDGKGYPTRLAGESIPLYGRILAIADTFDAMSSTRSYRQAMPRKQVLAEIAAYSGTQFDPSLTEPFIAMDFTDYDAMVERHQRDEALPRKDLAA